MNTLQVNILNPKAKTILQNMEKRQLISIQKKSNGFLPLLQKIRSNISTAPSLKEITKEVELVRSERYAKKNK